MSCCGHHWRLHTAEDFTPTSGCTTDGCGCRLPQPHARSAQTSVEVAAAALVAADKLRAEANAAWSQAVYDLRLGWSDADAARAVAERVALIEYEPTEPLVQVLARDGARPAPEPPSTEGER